MKYNTRIAPSPTGFFHLGTARVAYHNWLMARATGGKFIVRIDDTDNKRNDNDYVDLIYSALKWLGIDYDDTFTQSSRTAHYKSVADLLLSKGLAVRDGDAIRLNSTYVLDSWSDFNGDVIKVSQNDIDFAQKQVLIKSDGTPIYHFASIIDDLDTDINLVMRGADHLSNTSKQLFILKALIDAGYTNKSMSDIAFSHVGLIMVKDDQNKMIKLSKRNKVASLMHYKDNGVLPQSVLNAVLRLGWAHKDPNFDRSYPLVDKDDAIKNILGGNFKIKNATFDVDKLHSLDKKFKQKLS